MSFREMAEAANSSVKSSNLDSLTIYVSRYNFEGVCPLSKQAIAKLPTQHCSGSQAFSLFDTFLKACREELGFTRQQELMFGDMDEDIDAGTIIHLSR